jgi:hypothetical protein
MSWKRPYFQLVRTSLMREQNCNTNTLKCSVYEPQFHSRTTFNTLLVCLFEWFITSVSAIMSIHRQRLQRMFTNSKELRKANENTMHKATRHNDVP